MSTVADALAVAGFSERWDVPHDAYDADAIEASQRRKAIAWDAACGEVGDGRPAERFAAYERHLAALAPCSDELLAQRRAAEFDRRFGHLIPDRYRRP